MAFFVGCADTNKPTTRPATIRQRQDAALKDPFGYGPDATGKESVDVGNPNISGGGIGEFDKDAFKRDVDRFFNP